MGDQANIWLLADSGVRRFELCNIAVADLDLAQKRIRVMGKGQKQGYLVFGPSTAALLAQHLAENNPSGHLFDLGYDGLRTMLNRLGSRLGIKLNAHDFRRGFATTLRKRGVGELDIQQLGRWESLEMVRRYTRAYTFDDAVSRYKPIVE